MNISFRYEPEVCRYWIGATDGKHYKEFGLQTWMSVDDVIHCLKKCEEYVDGQS